MQARAAAFLHGVALSDTGSGVSFFASGLGFGLGGVVVAGAGLVVEEDG
ncbi:hypothetical protein GCM10010452_28190 [Crossiella cryophila]